MDEITTSASIRQRVWERARCGRAWQYGAAQDAQRSDVYLRTLLVHGARSALITLARRKERLARWAAALIARRGFKRACVAMAATA
jgi:hypothetical protein